MTYDGHGRLLTQKAPVQTSATVYTYNADDTVHSITDAHRAVQTIGYNGRHLVTATSYSAPAGITPTAWVTFDYDAAGRRPTTGCTTSNSVTTCGIISSHARAGDETG